MNQSFIDGERYGRDEAAKEHAGMVREFVALIRAEYPDMDEMIDAGEQLAQALETGAK